MNRENNLFEKICSIQNLHESFYKASKGKRQSTEYLKFRQNAGKKLEELRQVLLQGIYTAGAYRQFTIIDPKERVISAAPFKDRIVHHAIINVLEPVFEKQFIYHTYACRKGKGTHAAARYAFKCAKKYQFFLKLDVRKYFDSIDHSVLKNLLCRIIKDTRCLELLFSVIDSYEMQNAEGGWRQGESRFANEFSAPFSFEGFRKLTSPSCGLPIGNLTSQFFANLYLSPLDHFVLEQLKPKGYVRYMDDMVLFSDSLDELKGTFLQVERFCREKLHLFLKEPVFGKTSNGVSFLGWRITSNGIFLPGKTKRRMKKKLYEIQKDYNDGKISEEKMYERAMAVFASRKL